ncbi:G2E3 ligase, partial [Polypterus senegalus]|nr:G2E3 ligase [Polypterus senegalus]
MLVKFTDDSGNTEHAIGAGGPKREFLQLLIHDLQYRRISEGKGRVIAVSLIHGGPGPQFLSRNLVNYIVGTGEISPSIEDASDPDIYKMLQKIKMASSLNILSDTIGENGTMLLRTAAYCADHLLDIEASDKTSTCDPSLEDILMFATGLRALPPLGLQPRPTICFRHDGSLLPVANTCGNILTLPIHKTYDNFRFCVSFGSLNSPGLGQY